MTGGNWLPGWREGEGVLLRMGWSDAIYPVERSSGLIALPRYAQAAFSPVLTAVFLLRSPVTPRPRYCHDQGACGEGECRMIEKRRCRGVSLSMSLNLSLTPRPTPPTPEKSRRAGGLKLSLTPTSPRLKAFPWHLFGPTPISPISERRLS